MTTSRLCPICECATKIVLYRQRFENGPLGDGYEVVACETCGGTFADFIPRQDKLDEYYTLQSKYENSISNGFASTFDISRFDKIVDQAAEFLDSDSSILDIGCSTGGLLSVFSQHGYNNLTGIDPSASCAKLAAENYGVPVRVGSYASLQDFDEIYDLITLVGVLEHVREVPDLMRIIKGRLKHNGSLLVAVPDTEKFCEVSNAPFQQFSMEHVNFFTPHSLNKMATKFGLHAVSTQRYNVTWSSDVQEPVLSVVYRLGRASVPESSLVGTIAIKRYIDWSTQADLAILSRLNQFLVSERSLIVWGTGALTRRLLTRSPFRDLKIVAFVDSDPRQQGKTLLGKRILRPDELNRMTAPILICSVARESEIRQMIEKIGLKNDLLGLAD